MKKLIKNIFSFLGAFSFFYLLHSAFLADYIAPYAISLIFAIVYTTQNNVWLWFAYFLGGLLSHLTPLGVIIVVMQLLVIFAIAILKRWVKQRWLPYCFSIALIICQVAEIFIYGLKGVGLVNFLISVILSLLIFYLHIRLLSAIKNRGVKTPFALDELFSIFILITGVTLGAGRLKMFNIDFAMILTMLALLLLVNMESIYPAVFYAFSAGIAFMLAYNEFNYFVIFIIWMMALLSFRKTSKIIASVGFVVVDISLGLVFNVYGDYGLINFVTSAVGSIFYLCIPKRCVSYLKVRFEPVHPAQGQLDNLARQNLNNKFSGFINLLYDIDSIYKEMIIPLSSYNKSKQALAKDVCTKVCRDCINKKTCYSKHCNEIEGAVTQAIEVGIKKNGIKVIDMPSRLARCSNYTLLVSSINNASRRFLNAVKETNAGNLGKIAIGNQMRGVADALNDFNKSIISERREDRAVETRLLRELLYCDIIAEDCQITIQEDGELKCVSVLIKINENKNKFLTVVEDFFNLPLKISDCKYSMQSGWQIVSLVPKSKFAFTFGSATVGQNGKVVNGDCYSCLKLAGERYLLSIADGKGHGSEAEKTSNLTMRLIEKFFKANISTEMVVSSVNQILSFNNSENFSAVDISIVDMNTGKADFIKLGSTPTLIKRGDRVRVVSGEGLPMGASKMVASSYDFEYLSVGDIVIFSSDGVFDGFGEVEQFAGFVNNLHLINMEMLSKAILEESVRRCNGKIRDDLTVIAFRWMIQY